MGGKDKKGGRVKYNPETQSADNPDAKYDDVLVKAVEKMVKQISDMERLTEELSSQVAYLSKSLAELKSVPNRLAALEASQAGFTRSMDSMRHELDVTSFDTHANEDLRDYMMSEKNKDATDFKMTREEVEKSVETLKTRRRNAGLQ
jgi:hypothetical protein